MLVNCTRVVHRGLHSLFGECGPERAAIGHAQDEEVPDVPWGVRREAEGSAGERVEVPARQLAAPRIPALEERQLGEQKRRLERVEAAIHAALVGAVPLTLAVHAQPPRAFR